MAKEGWVTSFCLAAEQHQPEEKESEADSASQQPMEESGNKSLHNVFEKGGIIKLKALQMENLLKSLKLAKFFPLLSISIRQEE